MLVQQVEFLETILEETSDDLQSDSDCSGTAYWLGSDSETESVIHVRARHAGERLNTLVMSVARQLNLYEVAPRLYYGPYLDSGANYKV